MRLGKVFWLGLVLGPSACNADEGVSSAAREEKWKLEQLQKVREFSWPAARQGRGECLGRLAFEMPAAHEWALDDLGKVEDGEPVVFVDNVPGDGAERLAYENMEIWISRKAAAPDIDRYRFSLQLRDRGAGRESWEREVHEVERKIERAKADGSESVVRMYQRDLEDVQARLETATRRKRLEFDRPDVVAFDNGAGQIRVRYLMAGRIFTILARYRALAQEGEEHEKTVASVRSLVRRLRSRAEGEVPDEPGVCLPYAFIPDDGNGDYQAHATFRYTDHPSVIYTIDTGLKRRRETPGTAVLPVAAPVRVYSYLPTVLANFNGQGRQVKPLAPGGADIGPYRADQGGLSLNVAKPGEPDVFTYSIFTGAQGLDGWQTAPFIGVEMRGHTKARYPQLTENPPPMEDSRRRLDALLRSMHLRKTVPESAEFSERLGR